jgi:membrane dipeptidase
MRSDYFGRVSSKGLENVSRFPHLFAELVRLGFYERDIAKITAGNLQCVLRRVEAISGQLRKARGVIV